MSAEIAYLACPYTHPDPFVREMRFGLATRAAVHLCRLGLVVFSPITMTHPMDVIMAKAGTMGSQYWTNFDEAFMERCSLMYILTIDGWKESKGIAREREFFLRRDRRIHYLSATDVLG